MRKPEREGVVVRHNQKPNGKSPKQRRKEIDERRRTRGVGAGVDTADITQNPSVRGRERFFAHYSRGKQ